MEPPTNTTNTTNRSVVNHVGLCVADLARSRAFYEQVLGFEFWRDLEPPDGMTAKLTDLTPPLGVKVTYLRRNGFVLELMHYTAAGSVQPSRARRMNEIGLTHVSFSVADVAATVATAVHCGGAVLGRHGAATMIRDPDGQRIALLPTADRARLPD